MLRSARSRETYPKRLGRSSETAPAKPPEKEKPQKFFGTIVDAPRLARRKRDNEPYARFLLKQGDVEPESEPIPVMLTKK